MLRLVLGRLGMGDQLPAGREFYACPCCLVGYPREAVAAKVLTEEHTPPHKLGGRALLLTCQGCNSSAGSHFDAHAVVRAHADNFIRGHADGPALPVTSYVDGIPLRGTAQRTEDGGVQLFAIPKRNKPCELDAHFKALNAYTISGNPRPHHAFTVHTRFDEARARISWIRSAYLVAFAALGWAYIFREVFDPLRTQLQQPDTNILPTYIIRDLDAPPSDRRVLLVNDPDELRCVAVTLGEHTMILPSIFRPTTFDELVEAFIQRRDAEGRLNIEFHGKEIPWPSRPTYFLDRPLEL